MSQGKGQPSFLDNLEGDVKSVAPEAKEAKTITLALRKTLSQAVGASAIAAARNGDFSEESSALLKGFARNARLFGAKPEQMQELTSALGRFQPGMTEAELQAATQQYTKAVKSFGNQAFNSSMGGLLKGVGFAFAAVGSVKDWKNFSNENFAGKLQTVAGTLQLGNMGAQLASSILTASAANASSSAIGAGASAAESAAEFTGKFLGPAGAVLSSVSAGFSAVSDFENGNVQGGIEQSLTALGGITVAASAFLDGSIVGAPAGLVVGAVGGLISVAGAIVSAFSSPPDPFKSQKGDLKEELEAVGINQRTAEKLAVFNSDGSALGDWIYQVADRAGVSPRQFLQSMNNWSPLQGQGRGG